jgi:transposase
MAFREVGVLEVKEVLRLWLDGVSRKRIAAQLGLDVKTVRRFLKAGQRCGLSPGQGEPALDEAMLGAVMLRLAPPGRPQGTGWQICGEHRDFIRGLLDRRVKLTKVRKFLRREKQVVVSYATLRRFAIAELEWGDGALTIPVVDCGPGEELQLDTGWVGWLEPDLFGHKRRFRAWIFSAVRSRYRFVYPVFPETTQTAIEACEAAWEFFGGVFKVVIPDNTGVIVDHADPLQPRLNKGFLEYAQSRGFHIDPTRVRSPKDKARVERAVQSVQDDCFGGERIYSLEQARAHARGWCEQDYGMRRHSTTQRMPREQFEAEEKSALLTAPQEPYDIPLWCSPKVGRDQHAQVAKALYSLPREHRGRTLAARADSHTVRFYDGQRLVKTHPRMPPGKRSTDRNDFPPDKAAYAFRDTAYLVQRAQEHGEAVAGFAKALLDSPLPWTRMRQVYALLGLARRYGSARLEQACAAALGADMIDVYRLRRLLEIAPLPHPPGPRKVIPISRYLRPAQQYALPLASREKPEKGDNV